MGQSSRSEHQTIVSIKQTSMVATVSSGGVTRGQDFLLEEETSDPSLKEELPFSTNWRFGEVR